MAKGCLRNSGMVWNPFEKQLDPLGPIASRGKSVRPSVKYVGNLKTTLSGPSLMKFSGSVDRRTVLGTWQNQNLSIDSIVNIYYSVFTGEHVCVILV